MAIVHCMFDGAVAVAVIVAMPLSTPLLLLAALAPPSPVTPPTVTPLAPPPVLRALFPRFAVALRLACKFALAMFRPWLPIRFMLLLGEEPDLLGEAAGMGDMWGLLFPSPDM